MQTYDITIAANTSRQLDAPGSYFYYYAGSAGGADTTITLRGISSGLRLILKPGQAFRLPSGDVETSWILTNYANTATIIGTVLVGDGDITDNRVTGSVEVIDGGRNRTLANTTFWGYAYCPAVAGQFSHVQLWNPATNTKRLVVGQITYAINQAASAIGHLTFNSSPLANLNATNPMSKNLGGSVATGELRTQTSAGWLGTGSLADLYMPGALNQTLKLNEPIIVPPGKGLIVDLNVAANIGLSANFEFYEENI